MRLLIALPVAVMLVAGCKSAVARPVEIPDSQLSRLEQRLAELENRVNNAPPAAAPAAGHSAIEPRQQPPAALQLLASGNAAFAAGRARPLDLSAERIKELSAGQKPYAAVLACADSRTPPEHLFGAGLGDLFVVRCAGNVVDETALASVEYAVAHLGCRLVLVLGHTSCGAVKAAVADAKDTPAVAGLVARIKPAVAEARRDGESGLTDRAVQRNALRQREQLRGSQLLAGLERGGEVKLVVASYDLADGQVDWLDLDGLPAPASPSAPSAAPKAPVAQRAGAPAPHAH
jgi:carbonic anhydrase